jgi:hypothetical protein
MKKLVARCRTALEQGTEERLRVGCTNKKKLRGRWGRWYSKVKKAGTGSQKSLIQVQEARPDLKTLVMNNGKGDSGTKNKKWRQGTKKAQARYRKLIPGYRKFKPGNKKFKPGRRKS